MIGWFLPTVKSRLLFVVLLIAWIALTAVVGPTVMSVVAFVIAVGGFLLVLRWLRPEKDSGAEVRGDTYRASKRGDASS